MMVICHQSKAQVPTFATDIAPIVYNNCTKCHNTNGVANFMPFDSYASVSRNGMNVMSAVVNKTMPPWPPDPTYSRFLHERSLSPIQINQIADWVNNAMPRGDSTLEPIAPRFNPNTSQLGRPDTIIAMKQKYIKAPGGDEYRIFVLPLRLPQNKDVAAIEFVPGNPHICHHAIIALDTTSGAIRLDNNDPKYGYSSTGGGFGFNPTDQNWFTWVPGALPTIFPTGVGKQLFRKTDLLLQMHYGPSAQPEKDSSYVRIYYARTPIRRYINFLLMTPLNILNGPFSIPANVRRTFNGRMQVGSDISMISVTPHAHLICTSWKSFLVKPNGDTLNLIKIPKYDFHWQGSYTFPKFQKIPSGSSIFASATYDNRSSNPRNPSSPPRNVTWGEFTTDEMFLLGYSFVAYEPGDENISLESSITQLPEKSTLFDKLNVYPNPAKDILKIRFTLKEETKVSVQLFDAQGRTVGNLIANQLYTAGEQDLLLKLPFVPAGVYTLLATDGISTISKKLVIQK